MKKLTTRTYKTALLSLSVLILAAFSLKLLAVQPSIDVGPTIGSQMPELVALDKSGKQQVLSDVMGEKGAVIVLFRSADWCPFCKAHLRELNNEARKFKKLGYEVSAISYDSPKILKGFARAEKIKFGLLSDQKVTTFKALNVVNKMYQPGDRHYGIPYPGVIVLDSEGKVIHKYFYEGYKKRVKFKQLLKDLKQKH
jgi:peroxiredoxin